jgi:nucleoside-diphosphate-sugar epimerase
MKMKRKIIVIGGMGYIGSVLQQELKKENIEPIIIDGNIYNLGKNDSFINCNILDRSSLDAIFYKYRSEVNTVINLAAVVGDPACLVNTKQSLDINCNGTRNIIELANKYGFKVIHASTCSIYGSEKCGKTELLNEDSLVFPTDFYGQTKYQQERFIKELAKSYCIFRLGTAYGFSPRMRYDLVINLFSAKINRNEPIVIFGGSQFRAFCHIRDISRAFIFAYKNGLSGVYNLASENSNIENIALILKKKHKAKIEFSSLIEDPRNYSVSSKNIIDAGFKFKWNIEKGIKEMIINSKNIDYNKSIYSNKKLMEMIQIDESMVLITGGSGRLGRACRKIMPLAQYPSIKTLDIQNIKSIEEYFNKRKVNVVIHLAAMTGIPQCEKDRRNAYDINVKGTKRLLDVGKKNGVKHFVYLSTACVFSGRDDVMEDEDSLPYPGHYYGLTKYVAEEISKTYNSEAMKVTIVRTNFTAMPWEYPKAFTDRFGTYLFAQGVAKGLKDVIIFKPKNSIIHICGDRKISMYEYAKRGGSKVKPVSLSEYHGPHLTKDMSLTSKYWRLYKLEESSYEDN